MKADLYSSSVVVFDRGLTGLSAVLRKAVAHATANNIPETDLLEARLHPTMFPLYRQAQVACDFARNTPGRVLGEDVPPDATGTPTFQDLQALIEAAKRYLNGLLPAQFEGRDETPVTFPIGDQPATYPAAQYVLGFATQNFFFHFMTAYAILRHLGVDLGKRDYFGS